MSSLFDLLFGTNEPRPKTPNELFRERLDNAIDVINVIAVNQTVMFGMLERIDDLMAIDTTKLNENIDALVAGFRAAQAKNRVYETEIAQLKKDQQETISEAIRKDDLADQQKVDAADDLVSSGLVIPDDGQPEQTPNPEQPSTPDSGETAPVDPSVPPGNE